MIDRDMAESGGIRDWRAVGVGGVGVERGWQPREGWEA